MPTIRYGIGHSFSGKFDETVARTVLELLGYSVDTVQQGTAGSITKFHHAVSEHSKASIVQGFRVHLNAPLAHHNAMRKAAGRSKWSRARATSVAVRRSWS